jgi:helix-turn-helix protein
MNYTMDSVEHAKAVLIQRTKLKIKSFLPVLETDLNALKHYSSRYFFGVITLGDNVEKGILYFENSPFINVSKNSQIISLFQELELVLVEGSETTSEYQFEGTFRGFEIVLG